MRLKNHHVVLSFLKTLMSRFPQQIISFTLIKLETTAAAKLIEGLVLKASHDNNGAVICVGRAATVHNPPTFTLQLNP